MPVSAQAGARDRLFLMGLLLSLVGHAVVLGAELLIPGWGRWTQAVKPLKLSYEPIAPDDTSQWAKGVSRAHAGLENVPSPSAVPVAAGSSGGYRPLASEAQTAYLLSHINVGAVAIGGSALPSAAGRTGWETAVDLTNLAAASQGNPVLYAYFGAIREQIQQTANANAWLPETTAPGTAYIGFVIDRSGAIDSSGVVAERSTGPAMLRQLALRIVKASGPFAPFPPSYGQPSMAVVVPIEFAESQP